MITPVIGSDEPTVVAFYPWGMSTPGRPIPGGNPLLCVHGHRWLPYCYDANGEIQKCRNCGIERRAGEA